MDINAVPAHQVPLSVKQDWSVLEKYVLRRTLPQAILLDLVGGTWFTYYFWRREWVLALSILIITRALAVTVVAKPDFDRLAQTILGRLALLHLNPINLSIQSLGVVMTLLGLWNQTTPTILGGLSVIVLGHWFGWEKVHSAFSNKQD